MPTKRKTSKQQPQAIKKNQPLKIFFSRYSKFQYQPRKSPIIEFKRLCEEYRWTQDSAEKKTARSDFNDAIKKEFDSLYGSDEKNINNWYKLCHVLRIDPVPNTLKECSAAVLRKHVNLVDLVQGSRARENITIFESEIELSEYTKKTKKFFPKEDAADGGVLRALRRHILVPRESRSREANSLNLKSYHRQLRAFHSRVPIPSRHGGDAPGVSAHWQPYLTMSSPPHAFKFNSPINTPLLCSSPFTQCTTSPNLVPAAAQRGCTTTIPTTQRSSCHVTSHMNHFILANSHDRLYMSYNRLINRIGHMKDILSPTGAPRPRGVGLSHLFQYRPSLPRASLRASMRVRRVPFPVL